MIKMEDARTICNKFLKDLDGFLYDNIDNLTCSDVHDIYSDFFRDLKDFKGNSSGFTGLSEYIIFHFILHLLGSSFVKVKKTNELYEFVSKDGIYQIGQNTPLKTSSKRYYPDIIVYKKNLPILIVEIKIYLTNGITTLMEDLNKLKEMNTEYPNSKGLFICYWKLSEKNKTYKRLLEEVDSNSDLNYIILDGNNDLFKNSLLKCIE